MARPPSTEVNETFLREVDEDLRRDQVRDFFVKNRALLITGVVLFLAVIGGLFWWQNHQRTKAGEQVEELARIYRDFATRNFDGAPAALQPLATSSNEAVAASALFTAAAVDIEKGDQKAALAKYRGLAADDGLPQPYRDIALIRQTALEFDQLKPDEVIARMKPLAVPGGPWFGSAGEMTALALVKQGKRAEAGKLFAAIARDKSVPESLRSRSVQIASSLGVDASDAMPAPAQ